MSNRQLSDEFRYVFDRKSAQRMLGNTLDRPKTVLKRTFIRDTEFKVPDLNKGTNYDYMEEKVRS